MGLREKEENQVFHSLSKEETERYFEQYRQNGGNVSAALDGVVGKVWFDRDGAPNGSRYEGHPRRYGRHYLTR